MSGRGKDEPRVGYADDEVALTQKLKRPKLSQLEKPSADGLAPLRPKEGGAVDAEALRRIRRVSGPNHVAIRMPETPTSTSDRTVSRSGPLPVEAYPQSEAAPSTIPEEEESTQKHRFNFDDVTERAPDSDSETSDMVTQQVPPDVARRLLSEVAGLDHYRETLGRSTAASDRRSDPLARTKPAVSPAATPAAVAAPAPSVDARLGETLASLPKVAKELPQFQTLPLGTMPASLLDGPLPAMGFAPAAPAAPGSSTMPTVPNASGAITAKQGPGPSGGGELGAAALASSGESSAQASSGATPALPSPPSGAMASLGSSGAMPSLGSPGAMPSLGSSGATPSLGSSGATPSLGSSGATPSLGSSGAMPSLGSSSAMPSLASSGAMPVAPMQPPSGSHGLPVGFVPAPVGMQNAPFSPPAGFPPQSLPAPTGASRRSKAWIGILFVVVLLVAAAVGAWFVTGRKLPSFVRPVVVG